ncbi:MAG TPA: MBL fold metallo-hydrolase [Blastocatellia bacterium]|nr:MBL fold metallo-hydrolase [Blastocatellia bacterium]
MAQLSLRLKENVSGDFYVDSTCIDYDLCRQIAPATFHSAGEQSAVYRQPRTPAEEMDALKALVTCPTASIGALGDHPVKEAVAAYPEQISENVYFCGFASESSFGASSYLIVRPEGNVLVDSPRMARPLARRIEELGGARWMFLTHRDDVADHEKWAAHFNAERVMHRADMGRSLAGIERPLTGDEPAALDADLLAIPTPGHTRGHTVLLYRNKFLFTGDHLWWSDARRSLYASPNVCWYSWTEQTRSVERLLDYEFEWVLPGHGRRAHANAAQMRQYLQNCLAAMRARNRQPEYSV